MSVTACGKRIHCKDIFAGFCCCVCFATALTLVIGMNALFTDWLTSFETGRGSAAAVQATCLGMTLGLGLLAGMLERKVGTRVSLVLGSGLAGLGLFSGGFAPSLPVLILCVGVVTGSGLCLLHLASLSCAMKRFRKRAAFVSAIMSCSSGLSHLGTPLLYRYTADQYTWRGALIVFSGIALHSTIFGLLLTSPIFNVNETSRKSRSSSAKLKDDDGVNEAEDVALLERKISPRAPTSGQDRRRTPLDSTAVKSRPVDEFGEDSVLVTKTSSATADGNKEKECELASDELNQPMKSPETGDDVTDEEDDVAGRTGEHVATDQGKEDGKRKVASIPAVVEQDADSSKEPSVVCSPSNGNDRNLNGTVEPLLSEVRFDRELPANDLGGRLSTCDLNPDLEAPGKQDNNAGGHTELSDLDMTEISQTSSSPYRNQPQTPAALELSEENTTGRNDRSLCQSCLASWKTIAAHLINPIYLGVLLCTVLQLSTIISFVILVLDFADHKGWTQSDGIFLNFVFMLSTLISRVLVGVLSLWKCVQSVALLIASALIGSFGLCVIGQVSSFGLVCFLYACMAAGYGGVVGMFPPAVLAAVGPEMCALGIGLLCTVEGTLDAVAGIATGALVEILGSYKLLSIIYGSITVASSVLLLVVYLCHKPKPPEPTSEIIPNI